MWATGSYVIDPVISVVIGVIIIVGAYRLLKESVDVLLEATPVGIDTREVADVLEGVDGVEGIHDLHVWSLTSGVHALSCHGEVKPQRLEETDAILDRIRATVDERFGIDHTTIQIESEHYKGRSTVKWRL